VHGEPVTDEPFLNRVSQGILSGSDTTTGEGLREATEPWWSHLWSHSPTFVQVHRHSHQYDGAGHGRERYSANYCPES
jgi:hypothetical protein